MHESEKKEKSLSRVQLIATPWTAAYQAPPSMGFSRQEYWSGMPLPSLNNDLILKKNGAIERFPNISVNFHGLFYTSDYLPSL